MIREVAEKPDHHRKDENNSTHLLEILATLFPRMSEDRLCCRDTVWRKLHYKRKIILLEEAAHNLCSNDCQEYTQSIQAKQHQSGMFREESSCDENVHRHSAGTRHQRNDKHRDDTALPVLDGSGCHDCRDITAEAHDHRNEGLSVKTYLMHESVHDEGTTSHVS